MQTRPARSLGPPDLAPPPSLHRFFTAAMDRATAPGRILQIAIPAPMGAPDLLLRALDLPDGFLYAPPGGEVCAGVGATVRLQASGPQRIETLRREAHAIFQRIDLATWPETKAPPPRMHGGLAFGVGTNEEPPWDTFGDGAFTLPRWYFLQDGNQAILMHSVDPHTPDARARSLAELDILWAALERDAIESQAAMRAQDAPTSPPTLPLSSVRQLDYEVWEGQIDTIREAIRGGGFQKIVAARQSVVYRDPPFDPLEVFRRLSHEYPNCNLFLFQRPGATFLGATPENLCVKRGDKLLTHALAGSRFVPVQGEPEDTPAIRHLLDSEKDGWEHEVVVRQIIDSLEPLASDLDYPAKPDVVRVRNILHLNTPIQATLLPSTHPLDVVGALHPTSAVGGVPRWESVRWIQAHEGISRGWYAGPVGWFDANGDGEFVVAIRSGLLHGNQATLFAGAGIVEASNPRTEYEETALKQQPMLRALGVDV